VTGAGPGSLAKLGAAGPTRTLLPVHDPSQSGFPPANPWLRRALCVGVLALLPSVVSCRSSKAGDLVAPGDVPVELRDEWQALMDAQQKDRESTAIDQAADAILDKEAPADVHAQALLAKAERQYLVGNDADAIALADEALAKIGPPPVDVQSPLRTAIHATLARALVRGGDAGRALTELDWLEQAGAIEPIELRGARAVALDRQGDRERALAAYVAWRELLKGDEPDAGYAEERIAALVVGLDRTTLEGLAAQAPGPDAADCLRATVGIDPGDQAPAWVLACRPLPARVGIMLPRTGKLAALADAQLAAAVASVTVLGRERPIAVIWRDSGSTPETSRKAADLMIADGAEVIVGPVGSTNVKAAIEVAGSERLLLPGEGSGQARGVAPTLEQRARALLEFAGSSVVVMVPTNGYGERVRKALEKDAKSLGKSLKIIEYSPTTTSFGPVVSPVLPELRKGATLLVGDALSRTELIVRQLRREKLRVLGGVDKEGNEFVALTTAEGLSPASLGKGHESLEGMVVAPVAWPDKRSRAFEDEFARQQGSAPDDQALLVFRALDAAWSGASVTHQPEATLLRVQGGKVVPLASP
jgi:ABC-type branched-subunit amino acid transport system substrate-binding protein